MDSERGISFQFLLESVLDSKKSPALRSRCKNTRRLYFLYNLYYLVYSLFSLKPGGLMS